MPIMDLARDVVVTATPDATATDLARRMRDENVGSVVITDDDGPTGIVTDRDLTTRILADGGDAADWTAGDVMSSDLRSVGPDAGFYEAARTMQEHGVRRLPVCEGDDLVGIITADDLTELLSDEHQQLADVLRVQRPEY